ASVLAEPDPYAGTWLGNANRAAILFRWSGLPKGPRGHLHPRWRGDAGIEPVPQERPVAAGLMPRLARPLAVLLAVPAAAAQAMEFRPVRQQGATVLLAEGEIIPGDARRLATALSRQVVDGATILLDSPGGSVGESLVLGDMIRQRRLATA